MYLLYCIYRGDTTEKQNPMVYTKILICGRNIGEMILYFAGKKHEQRKISTGI